MLLFILSDPLIQKVKLISRVPTVFCQTELLKVNQQSLKGQLGHRYTGSSRVFHLPVYIAALLLLLQHPPTQWTQLCIIPCIIIAAQSRLSFVQSPLSPWPRNQQKLRLRLVATSVHITYYVPASHKNQLSFASNTIMHMYSIIGCDNKKANLMFQMVALSETSHSCST